MTAPPSGLRRNSSRSPERLARRLNPRCVPARTSNTADTRRHRQTRLSRRSEAIPQLAISVSTDWLGLGEVVGAAALGVPALQCFEVQPSVGPAHDFPVHHGAFGHARVQGSDQFGERAIEAGAAAGPDLHGAVVVDDADRYW